VIDLSEDEALTDRRDLLTDKTDEPMRDESSAEEEPLTIMTIPEDKAQAVLDFVASLQGDEADVSGHMLSTRLSGGLGAGPLYARSKYTMTGCKTTGEYLDDYSCSDSDQT
jgi:hypothetical protein